MLDTANRSCVSRPCKNLPHIYSMITVQNRVVVSHTVYPHEGGPRNVGDARAHASDGAWLSPWKHATPTCITIASFVAL